MATAFTVGYTAVVNKLIVDATICSQATSKVVRSLWDTGATGTCISQEIAEELSLVPCGKAIINTPSGQRESNTYLIDLVLPNDVTVHDLKVTDAILAPQRIGLLVGMDIISRGDLAVSHHSDKTVFTFRMPSMKKTDYVAEAKLQQALGPKHGQGKRKKR